MTYPGLAYHGAAPYNGIRPAPTYTSYAEMRGIVPKPVRLRSVSEVIGNQLFVQSVDYAFSGPFEGTVSVVGTSSFDTRLNVITLTIPAFSVPANGNAPAFIESKFFLNKVFRPKDYQTVHGSVTVNNNSVLESGSLQLDGNGVLRLLAGSNMPFNESAQGLHPPTTVGLPAAVRVTLPAEPITQPVGLPTFAL